jgi:uncharacterized protein YacL
MNIIIGIIAIAAPVAIYWFIVKPRLKARFTNLYSHIDSFWARWWARAVAFRTLVFGTIGLVLPELINFVASMASSDISALPDSLENAIRISALIATMLGRAMATSPREEPPKG